MLALSLGVLPYTFSSMPLESTCWTCTPWSVCACVWLPFSVKSASESTRGTELFKGRGTTTSGAVPLQAGLTAAGDKGKLSAAEDPPIEHCSRTHAATRSPSQASWLDGILKGWRDRCSWSPQYRHFSCGPTKVGGTSNRPEAGRVPKQHYNNLEQAKFIWSRRLPWTTHSFPAWALMLYIRRVGSEATTVYTICLWFPYQPLAPDLQVTKVCPWFFSCVGQISASGPVWCSPVAMAKRKSSTDDLT